MMDGLVHLILVGLEDQILGLFVLFLEAVGKYRQIIRRTLIAMAQNANVPYLFVDRL